MKILLVGLTLMVAWKSGYILLTAGFLAGFYLVYDGVRKLQEGKSAGRRRLETGLGLGAATALLMILLNLGLAFLVLASIAQVCPTLFSYLKEVLGWLASL